MPAAKINEVVIDHRAPWPTSADLRATFLGRPLTPIERAADDEADRITDQKDASHAMWQAQLSDRAKRRWGIAAVGDAS